MNEDAKKKWYTHKANAKKRNIPFHLTFEEWWDIWQVSDKWNERGKQAGQYCMSRLNDHGAYEVGNVFIQLHSDNMSDRHRIEVLKERGPLKITDQRLTKENNMSMQKGLKHPEEYTIIGDWAIHEQRFISYIAPADENGCMLWTGGRHVQQYGMFNYYNVKTKTRHMSVAHKIAMMLHLDRPLAKEEFVIHEFCDNPHCCNPHHMIVGDADDRNRVRALKGRQPGGPNQPSKQIGHGAPVPKAQKRPRPLIVRV